MWRSSSNRPNPETVTLRVRDRGDRHLAVRAQTDLQALLPHSRARSPPASRAPGSACSSSGRWSRDTAARCSRRATARAAAARSSSVAAAWRRHEPHPDRRGRAASCRRTALQPEAEQHDVDVVDTGEDALAAAGRRIPQRFDLVILDVMLPGMDGFDVVANCGAPVSSCRC